jgi:hypothetical protein
MYLNTSGNLLIGTTTDSGYKLDVNGTGRFSANLRLETGASDSLIIFKNNASSNPRSLSYNVGDASFSFNSTGGSQVAIISNSGAATFSSSVTSTAFFESSSIAGKNVLSLNPITSLNVDVIKYTRKNVNTDDVRYGYSAEQINSLMPELTNKDVTAVKYLDVHTLLIAELQREIKELKSKLNK